MFPTFISILDIQSWWEVPCIAHFCSLFRTAFNLLDFDIEDLEEALLTDGTEETSWLQELIARLISGCLPNNEISTFNYQMFLRRLFRQKCQEHDRYNPFNTDCDFTLLPLRTKVDILYSLCDFRLGIVIPMIYKFSHIEQKITLDAEDVLDQLKNLEADSLRVEPLGHDSNESAYWYFYGTRLYREDFQKKNNKKKSIWQVICFTEADWLQLTKKFKDSTSRPERALYHTLSKNFLPELPRLFKEKERQARKRLLESHSQRASERLRNPEVEPIESGKKLDETVEKKEQEEINNIIREKEQSVNTEEINPKNGFLASEKCEANYEMGAKKKGKSRQRRKSSESSDAIKEVAKRKKSKDSDKSQDRNSEHKMAPIGRQTNNSLSAADGQIVIKSSSTANTTNKKKLKTSQVFQQTDEDLAVGMHKILDYVKNHEDAWPFEDPVKEDYAPNYFAIIRRPMDLKAIEKRLDQGYYKTFDTFKGDFQLMVNNCRLYNGVENEYTKMADNISKAFEKATEKYLDQIFSSDEEIAVENLDLDGNNGENQTKHSKKRKHSESHQSSSSRTATSNNTAKSKRHLSDSGVTKKKERSPIDSLPSSHYTSNENSDEKQRKKLKYKNKELKKETEKDAKKSGKEHKIREKELKHSKKFISEKETAKLGKIKKGKVVSKTELKNKFKEEKIKKKGHKKKKLQPSKSRVSSPTRSVDTPPPSSPEDYQPLDTFSKFQGKKRSIDDSSDDDQPLKKPAYSTSAEKYSTFSKTTMNNSGCGDSLLSYTQFPFTPPAKDKHNKLRETIEKLKAKSEISRMETTDYFDVDDHHKENKDKNHKRDKNNKTKHKSPKIKKTRDEINGHSTTKPRADGTSKLSKKKEYPVKLPEFMPPVFHKPKQSNFDALSLATEQTLKDIDKWLDDTPKFDEYSSASNSPGYTAMDEFDLLSASTANSMTVANSVTVSTSTTPATTSSTATSVAVTVSIPNAVPKIESIKVEKIPTTVPSTITSKKDTSTVMSTISTNSSSTSTSTVTTTTNVITGTKDTKKKSGFKDPSKFLKRREIQRTIDRLQPGKSKGNLISNVQNASKNGDDMFPLGPLSKIKDTKNSLIVKTDTNAPRLSLGSVLDNFGKHKFVDDPKKDEDEENRKDNGGDKTESEKTAEHNMSDSKELTTDKTTSKKEDNNVKSTDNTNNSDPTPNLSAWFKAFGAPKAPPQTKKIESKPLSETKDENESSAKSERVPVPDPSPSLDSPQPLTRQRRMSTGSSMSERSSFSQDLDSPRVGMDERGAYPAPYPSPLHRSPSGASPIMASPRPDISPRSAYHFNGQMRVGFYQDTVSNKSSPDKSCSPRDNPQSPYYNASEHVYASNGAQNNIYSYGSNSPYPHQPNYSTTNPTPPYNTDMSSAAYYDTSKSIAEQYQGKSMQNYTANSPAHSQPSPVANQPQLSPHSPIIHPQMSPNMHSQHSPSVHSPSMHSPNVHPSQHSPNINSPQLQSPNQTGLHSPGMNTNANSPQMSMHSPQMNVHSPQMNVHSPQMSVHSPQMSVHSPMQPSPVGMHQAQGGVVPVGINSPHHSQVNSPMNCGGGSGVETFHVHQDDNSNSNPSMAVGPGDNSKIQGNVNQFPVKKRAFVENEQMNQFGGGGIPNEMVNRNMHMSHQLEVNSPNNSELEAKQQMECQNALQHQQQQQQQSQLLQQQLHLQQQKQSLLRQAQQNQQQQAQHQFNQQNQQQMQQLQQQPPPMYVNHNDSSLPNPSSPIQQQQQQQSQQMQQQQQQMPPHNAPAYVQPPLQQQQQQQHQPSPYGRESYPLNIPSANRLMQQHQQNIDMSKFTNMGYTGADVNYSRALQQQYGRPDLNYTRPPVPQSSSVQLLNQPVSVGTSSTVPNHQNKSNNSQQMHNAYQANRSVESVAERLAAQNQPTADGGGYKPEMDRNNFNPTLDVNLGRNLSNIVDRYNNEQRMMAGLQPSGAPYYTDKGMGNPHVFNKAMPSASQIFSQTNVANMNAYNTTMAATQAATLYNRQMNELQNQVQTQAQNELKPAAPAPPEKKPRKKKSKAAATSESQHIVTPPASQAAAVSSQGFQSYVGLKGPATVTATVASACGPPPQPPTTSIGSTSMEPSAISLKTSSVVPGSAFNFGPAAPGGPLGALGPTLYGDKDAYSNLPIRIEDFRSAPNFYMAAAAAHHRTTPAENPAAVTTKSNHQTAAAVTQSYPSFLNPAHQSRPPAYPLGSPFIPPTAQTSLVDTTSPLYQHYLQAGVLNQGLLGPAGAYPPGYHAALAMRPPYDSITRPSWL